MTAVGVKSRSWFGQKQRVYDLWLGKHCVVAAWLGLLLAVLSSSGGVGFELCWFKAATHLPCPGCGLTRSLACGIQGMLAESWRYHPMGPLILGLFVFTATQSLLPGAIRERIAERMQARATIVHSVYVGFVITFLVFGTIRALLHWG